MRSIDPFNIPLEEFNQLTFDEWKEYADRAYELCRREIRESFEEAEYVVVCNRRVILATNNPSKVSGQEISRLMEKYGKPCYTFSRPLAIEEVSWSIAVEVMIGAESWNAEELREEGKNVVADFNTGNPYPYLILDERLSKGIVSSPTRNEFIIGEHLGRRYYYFLRVVHVGIMDIKRKFKSRKLLAQLVRDWRKSPFIETSPYREGFTGRHLMFDFNFKITLDPKSRTSLIEYLD